MAATTAAVAIAKAHRPCRRGAAHRHHCRRRLLAQLDRHSVGFEQVVQLLGSTQPVIPGVTQEVVAEVGVGSSRLNLAWAGSMSRRCHN